MKEKRCLESAPASLATSLPLCTHDMRCRSYQAFGEKKGIPSHSNSDVTSFHCRCIVDSISSLRQNQVNKVKKRGKGEELTTATILSPLFFVSSTIRIFCCGVVRENTISVYSLRMISQVSSVSCSTSSPVKTIAFMGSSSPGFISEGSRIDAGTFAPLICLDGSLPESVVRELERL